MIDYYCYYCYYYQLLIHFDYLVSPLLMNCCSSWTYLVTQLVPNTVVALLMRMACLWGVIKDLDQVLLLLLLE